MSLFSFFFNKTPTSFPKRYLDFLSRHWIQEAELMNLLSSYYIKNVYDTIAVTDCFDWENKDSYLEELRWRLDLIEKYEPWKIDQYLSVIWNPVWWNSEKIAEIYDFLLSEWIKSPFLFIEKYQYSFFWSKNAFIKVKEKYEYIKNHPYLVKKLNHPLEFSLNVSYRISLKIIGDELEIYQECELIDFFITKIKQFWYLSDWEQKMWLFKKYNIWDISRNIFLKKYFFQTLTRNCTIKQLDETLSHWCD